MFIVCYCLVSVGISGKKERISISLSLSCPLVLKIAYCMFIVCYCLVSVGISGEKERVSISLSLSCLLVLKTAYPGLLLVKDQLRSYYQCLLNLLVCVRVHCVFDDNLDIIFLGSSRKLAHVTHFISFSKPRCISLVQLPNDLFCVMCKPFLPGILT